MVDVTVFNGSTPTPQYHEVPWYGALLGCHACPCRAEALRVVPGAGPLDASILVVGQNPGQEEDARGVPFVGRSGDLLAAWLDQLGLSRDKILVTNIVKCHTDRNRTPRPKEIDTCQGLWLRQELESFTQVQVIIPLGRPALFGLVGKVSPLPEVLDFWWMHTDLGERRLTVIPLAHPSYLLRFPGAGEKMASTLVQARQYLTQEYADVYARSRA